MYPYSSYSYVYNGYVQARTILIVALLVAVILAVVLYFTFLSKKNEGKFTGIKGKIYNPETALPDRCCDNNRAGHCRAV